MEVGEAKQGGGEVARDEGGVPLESVGGGGGPARTEVTEERRQPDGICWWVLASASRRPSRRRDAPSRPPWELRLEVGA